MFNIGDHVYTEPSAEVDFGFQARAYLLAHPHGVVKAACPVSTAEGVPTPESERVYCIEFDEEFSGGISCYGATLPRRGQFVTAKHLTLCFEASRPVTTVPQIG